MKKLRPLKKLELLVGIGFSLIGFFIGSLLMGNTLNSKIQLDSPKEIFNFLKKTSLQGMRGHHGVGGGAAGPEARHIYIYTYIYMCVSF